MHKFDRVASKVMEDVAAEFDIDVKDVKTIILTFYRWTKNRITKVDLNEADNVENIKTNVVLPGFGKLYVRKADYVIKLMKRTYEREKEIREYRIKRKALYGQNSNNNSKEKGE